MWFGLGVNGGFVVGGVLKMHSLSSCSLCCWACAWGKVSCAWEEPQGILSFGDLPFWFHTLMSVKHLFVGCARTMSATPFIALLCMLVPRLFICLFVQQVNRCRQLLLCFNV